MSTRKTPRRLASIVIAVALGTGAGGVYAAATEMTSSPFSAGSGALGAGCTESVSLKPEVNPIPVRGLFGMSGVVVGGLGEACVGQTVQVTALGVDGQTLATGSANISGPSMTVPLAVSDANLVADLAVHIGD